MPFEMTTMCARLTTLTASTISMNTAFVLGFSKMKTALAADDLTWTMLPLKKLHFKDTPL